MCLRDYIGKWVQKEVGLRKTQGERREGNQKIPKGLPCSTWSLKDELICFLTAQNFWLPKGIFTRVESLLLYVFLNKMQLR